MKQVTRPMLGFKSFEAAQATLIGIELMHMLKKGQLVGGARAQVLEPIPLTVLPCYSALNLFRRALRKYKRHFRPAPPAARPRRRPPLAAMAAAPAPRGSPPQRLAARHSTAMRGLDMRLRIGEGCVSGVSRFEGLGMAGLGKLGGQCSSS